MPEEKQVELLKIKKHQIIEIKADRAIYGGKCIGELSDGRKAILEKALPGELVNARITKKKKSFIEARTVDIIEKSEHREESYCDFYPSCGGCKLLDVNYDYQTELKSTVVLDCIKRIGKVDIEDKENFEYLPIVKSDKKIGYRNKMEFTFSNKQYYTAPMATDDMHEKEDTEEQNFFCGFHAPRVYRKVIDIDKCYHQNDLLNKVFIRLKGILKEKKFEAYNIIEHTGFLRYMVLRITRKNDVMINLVTKSEKTEEIAEIADIMMNEFPEVKTFVNTINSGLSSTAFGEKYIIVKGDDTLLDYIGKYKFEIAPNSFFQVNPSQIEKLYDLILEFGELKKEDNVVDLYCGVGTISIYISEFVNSVYGIELVPEAIENAKKNCKLNNITNCDFKSGDLMKLVKESNIFEEKDSNTTKKTDVIITDPPRDGMHPKVVKSIIESGIEKIVYVSCNPSTFARDVELLTIGGYKLVKAQAVDMFPNTYHVETVGLLVKIKS